MKSLVMLVAASVAGVVLYVTYKKSNGESGAVSSASVATTGTLSPNLSATSPSTPESKSSLAVSRTIAFQSTASVAPNAAMTQSNVPLTHTFSKVV